VRVKKPKGKIKSILANSMEAVQGRQIQEEKVSHTVEFCCTVTQENTLFAFFVIESCISAKKYK